VGYINGIQLAKVGLLIESTSSIFLEVILIVLSSVFLGGLFFAKDRLNEGHSLFPWGCK
jgi:hypothetical protein